MVGVGIVGIGFMGSTHFKGTQAAANGKVVAICDRIAERLKGDWTTIRGNIGGSGGVQDLTGIRTYVELDDMLKDPDVDMVDICLPTHFHYEATMKVLKAGKHVILEKPIALTMKDADVMVSMAEKMQRYFMIGQVLRFFPEFAFIKKAVESGEYGKLLGLHLKRIISKPEWAADNWLIDPTKSGGAAIDLHIHDADFVHYLLGMPDRLFAAGVTSPDGYVDHLIVEYLYEGKNIAITAEGGWIAMPGLVFEHAYDAFFENATMKYDSFWGQPLTVFTADGGKIEPELPSGDPYFAEIEYAINCVNQNKAPEKLAAASAKDSLLLCLKEIESVQSRQIVSLKG